MLDIKLLNKIKPGDEVIYEDYFSDIKSEVHGIVEEIAVRRGRDENGNIYSDDCIYVDDGSIYGAHEVCYADIKDIKFKEYEIWLLGNDEDDGVLDFDVLIDDGYDTLVEARKCFNYFLDSKALKEFFEIKQISIPEEIKKLYLRLEAVIEEEPDMVCCTDVIEEVCFDANSIR